MNMEEDNKIEDINIESDEIDKIDIIDDFIEKILTACESPCDIYRIYVNIISAYKDLANKYYKSFLDKLYSMSIKDTTKEVKSAKKITAEDYYQMLIDFELKHD